MYDGIIRGTGDSRYLKSVDNFLARYPNYEAFAKALSEGTLPFDLNGINEDGWDLIGTELNRMNLLRDTTAALYELGPDAVPDDVFMLLGLGLGGGTRGFRITVLGPDGNPVEGVSVTGLTDKLGKALVTDEYGQCIGVTTAETVSITVQTPYLDTASKTLSVTSTGMLTDVVVQLELQYSDGDYVTLYSSGTFKLSPLVKSFDLSGVGGGGGGGGFVNIPNGSFSTYAGNGANGGVINLLGISAEGNRELYITVGGYGRYNGWADERFGPVYEKTFPLYGPDGSSGGVTQVRSLESGSVLATGSAGLGGGGADVLAYASGSPVLGTHYTNGNTPLGGPGSFLIFNDSAIGRNSTNGRGGTGGTFTMKWTNSAQDPEYTEGTNGTSGILYLRFHY